MRSSHAGGATGWITTAWPALREPGRGRSGGEQAAFPYLAQLPARLRRCPRLPPQVSPPLRAPCYDLLLAAAFQTAGPRGRNRTGRARGRRRLRCLPKQVPCSGLGARGAHAAPARMPSPARACQTPREAASWLQTQLLLLPPGSCRSRLPPEVRAGAVGSGWSAERQGTKCSVLGRGGDLLPDRHNAFWALSLSEGI